MKKMTLTVLFVVLFVPCFVVAGLESSSAFSHQIMLEDMILRLDARNTDAHLETWIDRRTGEEHSHWKEKSGQGSVQLSLEKMVVPHRPKIEVSRWNYEGFLSVSIDLPFIYTDGFQNFTNVPNGGIVWDHGGLNFYTLSSVHKTTEATLEGDIISQRIWANGSFMFENAEVNHANLFLEDYHYYDHSSEELYFGFVAIGHFDIMLTGGEEQIEMANMMFPLVVPEPATISILGLGAIAVFLRKK